MCGLIKCVTRSVTTPSIVHATVLKYDCKLHGREGWDSYSLCLENTLSKYHLTEKVLLSYTINCQMATPHIPKKEHRILFTCCNLSISLMWITGSRLLGKALWYTLYAVIESKPSGGSRRGARGTPYFWTKLRSEVPKKFWGGDWVPLN